MTTRILQFNIAINLIGLCLFGYWYFIDGLFNPPLTFEHDRENMVTEADIYAPGDSVRVWVDFCKHRNVPGTSSWSLVDTIQLFYPEKTANATIGCYQGWVEAVKLPQIGVSGEYHLEGKTTIQLNPIKTVTYEFTTESFTIIELCATYSSLTTPSPNRS